MAKKGVYIAYKKNGEKYYRASFTYKNKHISLGSYKTEKKAADAYAFACKIIDDKGYSLEMLEKKMPISYDKYVIIINFRDNNIYLPNPIYVRKKYISYYISETEEMKFSIDDLFYYMSHRILRRGGHLYVNDYGMQLSLGSRYGIKNYAVKDKDFRFVNSDDLDYRYENIEILNTFHGVQNCIHRKKNCYKAKIHVIGDYVIGYYDDAVKAAIAYNKAIDILKRNGIKKDYSANYIESISGKAYADIYSELKISKALMSLKGDRLKL